MSILQPEPCPPSWAGQGSVAEFILCDVGAANTRFVRKFFQDSTGTVTSVVDLDLEGAPYVVVGPAAQCSGGGGTATDVEVVNDPLNPVPVAGTVSLSAPTLAALETINAVVTGTVSVDNFPASVEVSNDAGNPLPVTGTLSIGNFPASVEVSNDVGNPLPVVDAPAGVSLTELVAHEIPLGDYDPNNFHSAPYLANEVFVGPWTEFAPIMGMQTLFIMDSQPTAVQIQWSSDGINHDTSILGTTPILIQAGLLIPGTWSGVYISNIPVNKFYRIRVVNGPIAGVSYGHLRMWRLRGPFGGTYSPLASAPSNASVALLTRSVIAGLDPNGVFVNQRVAGIVTLAPAETPLGPGAAYTSSVEDLTGYSGFTLLLQSDQVSATNGIDIQFSDTLAFTVIRSHIYRTYNAADVTAGSKFFQAAVLAPYVRIVYTNGGVAQTIFSLELTALAQPVSATDSIEGTVTGNMAVQATKNTIVLKNPLSGQYDNITRSPLDGLQRTGIHTAILKHEVATPILELDSWVVGRATVASSTVPVKLIAAPSVNRKTFVVKAVTTNTKTVFIGPTSATALVGYELAPGESVVLELGPGADVWGVGQTAASLDFCWIEVVGDLA